MRSGCLVPVLCAALSCVVFSPPVALAQWVPNGTVVSAATNDQLSPSSCPDGKGGVIVVWVDSRSAPYTYDLYAQRLNADGFPQWDGDSVRVCTAAGDPVGPVVAPDGAGGAVIVWEDHRTDDAEVYAQRVDSAGVLKWTADGVLLCNAPGPQFLPDVVSDGAGGAIAVWEDYRAFPSDVYAQRANASGVLQWGVGGVAICVAAEDQFGPRLIPDGSGGAIITWFDSRSLDFDIFAQRVNGSGSPQWAANGVALCTAAGSKFNPVIVPDGAGGAIVAWEDLRDANLSTDIYARRITASGVPQWATDGVALCSNDSDQGATVIASDGAGGAIVAWEDPRNGRSDIFVQRVNAAGATQWTADGVGLCTAVGSQQEPRITSDGAGGAIVAWDDLRAGLFNTDTYVQRVDASGAPVWGVDGLPLCLAGANQVSCVIATDGAGGAIVTWTDGRSGRSSDIYAQRVAASGGVPAVDVAAPARASFALFAPRPNPCRAGTGFAFALPFPQAVSVDVLDMAGRRVRTLMSGEQVPAGLRSLTWDGRDQSRNPVPAGIYLLRVVAASGSGVGKVAVLR